MKRAFPLMAAFFLIPMCCVGGQSQGAHSPVVLTVVDENNIAVSEAEVAIQEPGKPPSRLITDYNGRVSYTPQGSAPFTLQVQKAGFYASAAKDNDPSVRDVRMVLNHVQMLVQQVNVAASVPGIDPEQVSDKFTLATPEIINIPYPTSRDIRNLLPFYPGVVQDNSGQIHVAGSETWATLDLLDGFDIRSPVSGSLAMRVSPDAVRSIDQQATRYPVEFGRSTGGVVAFFTGMGDNKFRFNATNFFPSWHEVNGLRFDKFVPRVTFSGPLVRNRAWYFDGMEFEYDHVYIKELPVNADTNDLIRGSNLFRMQVNATPRNIISSGVLFNGYHSPYDGLSALVPKESTIRRDTIAWLPYVRDQHNFANGALLDAGLAVVRFRDGFEPHGSSPFELTPEQSQGSYFESLASRSQRVEGNVALYLPPRQWMGRHDFKAGIDISHIGFHTFVTRAPVNYLREDRTLLRQSTFPAFAPFAGHNVETGAYLQDRWAPHAGLLLEPGLRFDWDEIIRRPLFSPRLAAVYTPSKTRETKISAGIGLYYEHTQLEYLERSLAGIRYDTYYAADGLTPTGPAQQSTFTYNASTLHEAHAINWSVGLEQKLPAAVYVKFNFTQKRVSDLFTYANKSGPPALLGNFDLTNARTDHNNLIDIEARHTFAHGYALFGAYTHSTVHTNAAIDYVPTISYLGPQQSGPLEWDTPNRVLSWGWLPFPVPGFKKHWDFVYTWDWHSGFPFTAINSGYEVVGGAGSHRFPTYANFSPGLEVRFHFRGRYLGLRGIMENAAGREIPLVVNNVVDSPQFGTFSDTFGRALTARIRLIQSR
jgi:TonB dependent receptor